MRTKAVFSPERFKEAMVAANMTQTALAKVVGVSPSSIRRYMAGAPIYERNVSAGIARALNVNTLWLVGRPGEQMERTPAQKHLDKMMAVGTSVDKNSQLQELAIALADLPEEKRKEIAKMLGTPENMAPIEITHHKAKK